ncbi:tape measure protein [Levilactobacillus brevis]|uniref:tape measure protein n=1 Tax=Levilactobacillus brevis TaxID=1580 RepID=UPI0021A34274|nr:tape measure protein [Levilactobacillus brevis]MCT3574106.1 phage tail protein [Levilactobacillus brevis]
MGSTVSATIKINDAFSGPLNKLSAGLNRSASTMSNLSNKASETGSMFKSVLGGTVIGSGITKGISLIGTGLKSMYGELDESSRAWQTFNGNMKMIGQGPKQIASTRGDLQKFAQQTIYSASDMASTYSQLAAVGTKNTTQLVKGFGGLAAASSDPQQAMKTLSQQATQAAAKPKIQWMDFKLMLEQTPAGMAAVAKTMHKSTGKLVKDVQDGKVKTQDFFDAIAQTGTNKNFSKMATQYKTIGQAMDGLRETLANKMQPAFDKVSKVGIKAISGFTDKLGSVNFSSMANKIVPVIQTIVNAVKVAGQAMGEMLNSMGKSDAFTAIESTLSSIGKAFGSVFSKLASGGKDPFAAFKSIGSIAGSAISGAAKGIGALADVVGNLDPGSIKLIAGAFVALKMSTKGLVITAIVAGLTMLSKLDPGTLNAIAKGVGLLAFSFLALKAIKNVDGILTGLGNSLGNLKGGALSKLSSSATQAATGFIKLGVSLLLVGTGIALAGAGMWLLASATTMLISAGWPAIALFFGMIAVIAILGVVVATLGTAMIAGSVGFFIFAAALLLIGVAVLIAAAGVTLLATQLSAIATYGASAAGSLILLGAAMAVFGILSIVAALGLVLLGAGLAIVGIGFLVAAVGALLFGVAMALVAVTVTIAAVGMLILAVALPLIAVTALVAAVGMMLMAVALVMLAAVAMVAGAGMLIFALALVIAAPLMMIAAVGALLLGAASIVLGAGLMVAGAGLLVVAAGLRAVLSAITAMVSAFVSAVSQLVSGVTSGMAQVASAVRNGIQQAVSAAQSFGGALVSAGVNLIQGLINGIKSMIGSAVAAVKNVASSVVNAAKGALGIHSPSKVFAELGMYTVAGFANGISDNAGMATRQTESIANNVIGAMGVLDHVKTINPGDVLADGFNRAYDAITNVVGAVQRVSGQTIGINGQVSGTTAGILNGDVSSFDGDVPTNTPFGGNESPYTTEYSANSSDITTNAGNITIAPGAIQINSTSKGYEDAEVLVSRLENYLVNLNERRG